MSESTMLCADPNCGNPVTHKQLQNWRYHKRKQGPYCSKECSTDHLAQLARVGELTMSLFDTSEPEDEWARA